MHWHWADSGEQELILIDSTEDERASAERGIAELRMAGKKGETTGSRLHQAVESGRLPWELVRKLSSWCNTEGIYALAWDQRMRYRKLCSTNEFSPA